MIWRSIPAACGALLALTVAAEARPITYPGGSMLMLEADEADASVEAIHTLTPRLGVGLRTAWNEAEDWQYQAVVLTSLLYRDNQPHSQGNVFATLGLGAASADVASIGVDISAAAVAILEADWETRRVYVQGALSGRWLDGVDSTVSWRARAGFAPTLAPAGDVQPWLILQLDHEPEAEDPITAKAVLRLFSGPVLGEIGVSQDGAPSAVLWLYF